MVEKSGVESSWLKSLALKGPGLKLGVEKSGVEMSFNLKINLKVMKTIIYLLYRRLKDFSTPDFSTTNFSTPWFKNSWLKSPGLKVHG